ncbi:hypothetical protein Y032_0340g2988 [Ancylostoma ceylanicum]|uniref:Uncharacterized protein n=1 Tax=Ancylostoma ceylanicum TaxID=53326 RepID=A0A016RXY6_9BILA|nr:hypothetical protein Y032_0340g2988 [Ancylostoma ceylanicum]
MLLYPLFAPVMCCSLKFYVMNINVVKANTFPWFTQGTFPLFLSCTILINRVFRVLSILQPPPECRCHGIT